MIPDFSVSRMILTRVDESGAGRRVVDSVPLMPDRNVPRTPGDERGILVDFLDYLRESVVLKVADVSDDDARRPMVDSGTSLLGIVKHLVRVEVAWFQFSFAGRDVRVPTSELSDADCVQPIVESYRQEVNRSNEIVSACRDLSQLGRRPIRTSDPMPLRWVLVHMIEETGRHAGHADILREQIDGVTGR
jgi:uncharacterized damage-inducible protein DinB